MKGWEYHRDKYFCQLNQAGQSLEEEQPGRKGGEYFPQLHLEFHSVEASESPTRPPSIWSPQMPESQLIDWRVVRKVSADVVGSTLLSSQLPWGKKVQFLIECVFVPSNTHHMRM